MDGRSADRTAARRLVAEAAAIHRGRSTNPRLESPWLPVTGLPRDLGVTAGGPPEPRAPGHAPRPPAAPAPARCTRREGGRPSGIRRGRSSWPSPRQETVVVLTRPCDGRLARGC